LPSVKVGVKGQAEFEHKKRGTLQESRRRRRRTQLASGGRKGKEREKKDLAQGKEKVVEQVNDVGSTAEAAASKATKSAWKA
jgi:hypothetical protein